MLLFNLFKQIMWFELLRIMFSIVFFLMISEKKLINDLEKMYILLNFESFKIMIYIIPTKNLA